MADAINDAIADIKTTIQTFTTEHKSAQAAMQTQLDALDRKSQDRIGTGISTKSVAEEIFEHDDFRRLAENGGRGRAVIKIADWQKKALTGTAAGLSASGVLTIDRQPGITGVQFRQLRIRDLLRSAPTDQAACDYVKVSTFENAASPQVEAGTKGQSDMTLQSVSATVRTLAHWIRASKQILSDLPGLTEAVNAHLIYGLKLKEESQLLSGDGTGENLLGIIPQATAFDVSLLTGSWNRLDVVARAIQQAERTDYSVDIIVLNVDDFWGMALTKDSQGRYLFGDPSASNIPTLWGRPVAVTNSIGAGHFLVGASLTALIRDRMEAIVEVSENVNDDFIHNMVVLRCEERLCLQIMRPQSWIHGSMTTSPA